MNTKNNSVTPIAQKGVALLVEYPRGWRCGHSPIVSKVGEISLPVEMHAQACEDTIRKTFRKANAFRVFDQFGSLYFCGSL